MPCSVYTIRKQGAAVFKGHAAVDRRVSCLLEGELSDEYESSDE